MVRDLQFAAFGSCRARFRIRLQPRFSRGAGAVGGAVRRFRQRRADHHRPVHRRERRQVESAFGRGDASAARLRRAGAGTFERAHRALSAARRARQHPDLPAFDRRAVFSSAAAPGAANRGASRSSSSRRRACCGIRRRLRRSRILACGRFQHRDSGSGRRLGRRACCCAPGKSATNSRRSESAARTNRRRSFSSSSSIPSPKRSLPRRWIATRMRAEFVWVQEEPGNMGALAFVLPRLERLARGRAVLSVKRSASASPATGSAQGARDGAEDADQRRVWFLGARIFQTRERIRLWPPICNGRTSFDENPAFRNICSYSRNV